MNKSSFWIPSISSVASGIIITFLIYFSQNISRYLIYLIQLVYAFSPRLGTIMWLGFWLLPILLIAIAHHYLHQFLDPFFPDTRSVEVGKVEGFVPGLMSWWEGLYSWLVIMLAKFVSNTLYLVVTVPYDTSHFTYNSFLSFERASFTGIWLFICAVTATYLYNFERMVREHLISLNN